MYARGMTVQTCFVHLIRNSLEFTSWKDRKAVAAALKAIYQVPERQPPGRHWRPLPKAPGGRKYEPIPGLWRRAWEHVIPFFCLPSRGASSDLHDQPHIESLHMRLRKVIKARGQFPYDEAVGEAGAAGAAQHHRRLGPSGQEWKAALNLFAILYAERFSTRAA